MSGLGFRNSGCGGIDFSCIASTTFINPATPAADSRCPMFGLNEPIRSGRSAARPLPYTVVAARTSMGSPIAEPVPCASR